VNRAGRSARATAGTTVGRDEEVSPARKVAREVAHEREVVHESVYERLCKDLITGQLEPGRPLTVRGIARRHGVSPMPAREAVRRLVALGALTVGATRRISVTPMDEARFAEVLLGRTLLEPELAVRALPRLGSREVRQLVRLDDAVDQAIADGDAGAYGRANWAFHHAIYVRAQLPTLLVLVEALWLQVGPFMRQVAGRIGTANLVDQHEVAIAAIRAGDAVRLQEAIGNDIRDGMNLIVRGLSAGRAVARR
jgi:DNA-binding GntR family transcriptional regulator